MAASKNEKFVRNPDFKTVYSNNVQMSVSLWDMSLVFGEIGEIKDGEIEILQSVKISLSREMAKAVLMMLARNIGFFESQFGEIKIPDSDMFEAAIDAVVSQNNGEGVIGPKTRKRSKKST